MHQQRAQHTDGDAVRRDCDRDAACRGRVDAGHPHRDTHSRPHRQPDTCTGADAHSRNHSDADNRADPDAHGHTHSNRDADTEASTDANPDTHAPAHTAL